MATRKDVSHKEPIIHHVVNIYRGRTQSRATPSITAKTSMIIPYALLLELPPQVRPDAFFCYL